MQPIIHIRRAAFTLLALASLIICILLAGMYLRRNYESDTFYWVSSHGPKNGKPAEIKSWTLDFGGGVLRFQRSIQSDFDPDSTFQGGWLYNRFQHFASLPLVVYPGMISKWAISEAPTNSQIHFNTGGFTLATQPKGQPDAFQLVTLPLWFVTIPFIVPPILWELRYRRWLLRRRRIRQTLCPNCGYDLRATPDRCPECGTAPPNNPRRPTSTIGVAS